MLSFKRQILNLKCLPFHHKGKFEPTVGLEPTTRFLQGSRSTNWAKKANLKHNVIFTRCLSWIILFSFQSTFYCENPFIQSASIFDALLLSWDALANMRAPSETRTQDPRSPKAFDLQSNRFDHLPTPQYRSVYVFLRGMHSLSHRFPIIFRLYGRMGKFA